jgi:DNA helicase HerA-like ATPase
LPFHSPHSDNFIDEILHYLDTGKTVIVDLGSANEQIIRYFAKTLSVAVFQAQEAKFVSNQLNDRYVQIYFEEAHMIFPPNSGNVIDVYSRFAKEGAKFNIGIVYSTQSPSTVNHDLLAQNENFFIGHLSSSIDTDQLAKIQQAFHNVGQIIMRQRTRGLLHVLTHSHRYVIPVQANRYNGISRLAEN